MVSGARTGQSIFRSVLRTVNALYSYAQRTAPLCVLAFPAGSRSTRGPAREWRNGRRAGFRCQCPQGRGGSNPPSRTVFPHVKPLFIAPAAKTTGEISGAWMARQVVSAASRFTGSSSSWTPDPRRPLWAHYGYRVPVLVVCPDEGTVGPAHPTRRVPRDFAAIVG